MTEPYPPGDHGSVNPAAFLHPIRHTPSPTEWWKEYAPDELALVEPAPPTVTPPGVLADAEAFIDAPPITAPQAQGDVMVLPWPPDTTPAWRQQEVDAAEDVPDAGIPVDTDRTHVLYPEREPLDRVRYHPTGKGYTRGTLYVPVRSVARLSHRKHGDLLIGPGVYVLRQQRAYTGTGRRARTVPTAD